jgi:hypothetical protein
MQISEYLLRSQAGASRAFVSWLPGPSDLYLVLSIAVASRALVLLIALLFNATFEIGRDIEHLLCSWDCGWYKNIALHGYDAGPRVEGDPPGGANYAFFPLYPSIAWVISKVTGVSVLISATLLSNASFVIGLCILFRYTNAILDRESAFFAATALAFSPFAMYFSVPYTEALYFVLMIGSLFFARTGKWILAGLLGAGLSATRNLGVFIVFPLLLIAVEQYGWRSLLTLSKGSQRAVACLFAAPFGIFAYMCFLHHRVGDALAFANVQVAWGRSLGNPVKRLADALIYGTPDMKYWAASGAVSLAACVFLLRRKLYPEGTLLLIGTLLPMAAGVQSLPRFTLTLFPPYLALALMLRHHPLGQIVVLFTFLAFGTFMIISWVAGKSYVL